MHDGSRVGAQAVVFSQFTSILDICAEALRAGGVATGRIDGSSSAANRAQTLRAFGQEEGGPRVLLVSLRAGGVGLNLTRANHGTPPPRLEDEGRGECVPRDRAAQNRLGTSAPSF